MRAAEPSTGGIANGGFLTNVAPGSRMDKTHVRARGVDDRTGDKEEEITQVSRDGFHHL